MLPVRQGYAPYCAVRLKEVGSREEILYASKIIKGINTQLSEMVRINPQMESWYKTGSRVIYQD